MGWPKSAWDDPWSDSSDPRSLFLDLPQDPGFDFLDFGIYGDGGLFPPVPLVFVRKRVLLVKRMSIETVVARYLTQSLRGCRSAMAQVRLPYMLRNYFPFLWVYVGVGLTTGTYWYLIGARCFRCCARVLRVLSRICFGCPVLLLWCACGVGCSPLSVRGLALRGRLLGGCTKSRILITGTVRSQSMAKCGASAQLALISLVWLGWISKVIRLGALNRLSLW